MLTRETHSTIYQGEISQSKHSELESAVRGEGISPRKFILKEISNYLKNQNSKHALGIEDIALNDGRTRFYLWIPYQKFEELDHLMKITGIIHIQKLARKAIKQRRHIENT